MSNVEVFEIELINPSRIDLFCSWIKGCQRHYIHAYCERELLLIACDHNPIERLLEYRQVIIKIFGDKHESLEFLTRDKLNCHFNLPLP